MKMREAFKRLLDGEKITHPRWFTQYMIYNKEKNYFELHRKNGVDILEMAIFKDCGITFANLKGTIGFAGISNDDENEIYTSKEEKMELDAMKWRLYSYCFSFGTCGGCRLKNECIAQNSLNNNELDNLSSKEVKRLYDLISEEK